MFQMNDKAVVTVVLFFIKTKVLIRAVLRSSVSWSLSLTELLPPVQSEVTTAEVISKRMYFDRSPQVVVLRLMSCGCE